MASACDSAMELPSLFSAWYCGKCARYGVKTEIKLEDVMCHNCQYTIPSEVIAVDRIDEALVDPSPLNQTTPNGGSFRPMYGTLDHPGSSNWGAGNPSGVSRKDDRNHSAKQAPPASAGVGKSFSRSQFGTMTGGGTFEPLIPGLSKRSWIEDGSIEDCAAEALTSLGETHNSKANRSDATQDERRAGSATQISSVQFKSMIELHGLTSVERKCPNKHCRGGTWSADNTNEARCKKCSHFFPTKQVSAHRDSKVCECWVCGKIYFKENGLIEHVKTKHAGRKPFSCRLDPSQKICDRKFTTKHNREKHEANECKTIENPVRQFKCPHPECAKHPGYKRVAELKNHTTTKHEGNPKHVMCFVKSCTSCFANLSNRNKHAKRAHPLEWAQKQKESERKRKPSGWNTSRAKRRALPKKTGARGKSDGPETMIL